MTTPFKTITLLLLMTAGQVAYGQTNKDKALEKGLEAVKLMDSGRIDDGVKLLEEAQKLDPDRFYYPYEIAYARYMQKDYKGAVKILEKNENHKDVTDRLFQLLGNSYDNLGKSDKAIEMYEKGLKKFPNSGNLYLELGVIAMVKKDYDRAVGYYEKGIEVDPTFASNYYWAAKIYFGSTEEVWGMLYGELFMNIERNSKRTAEMSKLLFDTYKSEIKYSSDTAYSVSFSKSATINVNDLKDPGKIKLPFGIGAYEQTLMFSMLAVKTVDMNSLDVIRTAFVDNYYKNGQDKSYPNLLFDYQKQVKEAGHMEAYNHWILMKGDEGAFNKWQAANKDKWDSFIAWFGDNKMKVDEQHKFYRAQY